MGEIKYSNSFFRTLKETPIIQVNDNGGLYLHHTAPTDISNYWNMHDVWVDNLEKNKKESKEMEILRIYKEREDEKINKEYIDKKIEIKNKDKIQLIVSEMRKQIGVILENEDLDKYQIDFGNATYTYTKETKKELEELEKKEKNEHKLLNKMIDEVKALMELTENYEQKMDILENYGITKKGKLNKKELF